jgi:hypothetical protein
MGPAHTLARPLQEPLTLPSRLPMLALSGSLPELRSALRDALLEAPHIDVGEWQAISGTPASLTAEVQDVVLETPLINGVSETQRITQASLPWAEEHFLERVGGLPLNPPPSHERWPFRQKNNSEHVNELGQFSHTYPERFWPKSHSTAAGIRFNYGDLNDLIDILNERTHSRQAYLPIWFPEDLAASLLRERVPCSLGYHFMIRSRTLSLRYFMRSCDFLRHFNDDVYMAMRLAHYVADRVNGIRNLGTLVMHVSSLHVFPPSDIQLLQYRKSKGQ